MAKSRWTKHKRGTNPYHRCPKPECRGTEVYAYRENELEFGKYCWQCSKCGLIWNSLGHQYDFTGD